MNDNIVSINPSTDKPSTEDLWREAIIHMDDALGCLMEIRNDPLASYYSDLLLSMGNYLEPIYNKRIKELDNG